MNRKIVLVCVTLLLFSVIGTASAKTLYVDNCGCADFTKIQDAVNAANDGDIIIVRNGVYFENIKINKSVSIHLFQVNLLRIYSFPAVRKFFPGFSSFLSRSS